jgi:hypothetical protein
MKLQMRYNLARVQLKGLVLIEGDHMLKMLTNGRSESEMNKLNNMIKDSTNGQTRYLHWTIYPSISWSQIVACS